MKETDVFTITDAVFYLLLFDKDNNYFTNEFLKEEVVYEKITKRNFRLNKLLHLANILHYAKYGKEFFKGKFLVFSHGVVIEEIYYQLDENKLILSLLEERIKSYHQLEFDNLFKSDGEKKEMLRKIYNRFRQYSDSQLVLFSQEDPA